MRFLGMVLLAIMLPTAAHADKLIMVCQNVSGMRVDFEHSSSTFEEGEDGYTNSKHIFIFDENDPGQVSAKWQTAIPNGLEVSREYVDQIVKGEFRDEPVFRIDGLKIGTVYRSQRSMFTTMYDFGNQIVLSTRITVNGMGSDIAAYYKGRCERVN